MLLTAVAVAYFFGVSSTIAVKPTPPDPTLGTCEKSGTRCKFSPAASSISYCWSAPVWDKTLANTYHIGFSNKNTGKAVHKKSAVCFCPAETFSLTKKQATILDALDQTEVPKLKEKGLEIDAGNVDDECKTWGAECILDEKNQQCRLSVFYDPKTYCLPVSDAAGVVTFLYVDVPASYNDPSRQVTNSDRIGCYCQNWKLANGYFFHPALGMTIAGRKQAFELKVTESHKPEPTTFNDYSASQGTPGVPCAKK